MQAAVFKTVDGALHVPWWVRLPCTLAVTAPANANEELTEELEGPATDLAADLEPGRTSAIAALRYRDFRLFWFGLLVSNIKSFSACVGDVGRIDLLITDVNLDADHGRSLANRLCQLRPEMPVLFISGANGDDLAEFKRLAHDELKLGDAVQFLGTVPYGPALFDAWSSAHLMTITNLTAEISRNVLLGPWIHTGSRSRHLAAVAVGSTLTVRARVTGNYEHKGHRFVELDALVLTDETVPIAHIAHTAIYRPRQIAAA